ncbi:MAG: lysophospholipid acyltransferase family protein [Gemmata sp.]
MLEPDWPQVRYDRHSALGAAALVCLAVPVVAVLVGDLHAEARRVNLLWFAGTAVGFALLPFLYWAPYRALGFVPPAAVAWLAAVGHGAYWNEWTGWAHGAPLGLIVGALARGRHGPEQVAETLGLFAVVLGGAGAAAAVVARGRPYDAAVWFALLLALGLCAWGWVRLLRPALELLSEPVLWAMYRVRADGPGFPRFPRTGPCLVIANHACWLDPLFLAKVLPRPLTPMMTATFYDLPLIRQLMVRFGVIRVPAQAVKRDAPEVQEAVAALDRGECVLIFPEGYLRRADDRELRRFGQGVWQLLTARPDTPVFAGWIAGGWGSYTSHRGGPPVKGKRPDVRRPIRVGLSGPLAVPPEVLTGHLAARLHLMNEVSAARAHVGLAPLPPFAAPDPARGAAGAAE